MRGTGRIKAHALPVKVRFQSTRPSFRGDLGLAQCAGSGAHTAWLQTLVPCNPEPLPAHLLWAAGAPRCVWGGGCQPAFCPGEAVPVTAAAERLACRRRHTDARQPLSPGHGTPCALWYRSPCEDSQSASPRATEETAHYPTVAALVRAQRDKGQS